MADYYEDDFSDDFSGSNEENEPALADLALEKENIVEEDVIEAALSDSDNDDEEARPGEFLRPEVLLAKLKKEISSDGCDFAQAKVNAIKCLALCKIIHGEDDWKVAEAHINLSNVYLKGKYFPLQAIKHAKVARDQLLLIQKTKDLSGITDFDYMLMNLYYVMGRANLQSNKNKVAENCLLKAKLVSDNTKNAITKYLNMKVLILSSLATVSSKLGQPGQAINLIEEAQDINDKLNDSDLSMAIKLNKQIVNIELQNKQQANFSLASETCDKALKLAIESEGQITIDAAEIYNLKSRIELLKDTPDYKFVTDSLTEEISIYEKLGEATRCIGTRQMLCKVLLQQNKAAEARILVEQCIEQCEILKGDMSLQSAELYELMGSILYSLNEIPTSIIFFTKAEEIYRGKKIHKSKQEKILKLIDMVRKGTKDDKLKTAEKKLKNRPRFN